MKKVAHKAARLAVFTVTALTMTACLTNTSEASDVPTARDFQSLKAVMETQQAPLLLAVTADYCHFCEQLKDEYLQPMMKNAEDRKRVVIRTFDLDGNLDIVDFDGKTVSVRDFSQRYEASLTPTVLFLNSSGKEVADKILGFNTPELYGAYLEKSIDTARQNAGY